MSELLQLGHQVVIAGREMLCAPEKFDLYRLVGQDYFLTNGIILSKNESIFDRISKCGIKKIRISWHFGFAELSGQIPEEVTTQAIRNARRHGFAVEINCVVGNKNFESLGELCERAVGMNVGEIVFLKLLVSNDEMSQYALSDDQINFVFLRTVTLREKYDRQALCIRLHPNFDSALTERSIQARRAGTFCPAGRDFFTIDTDNQIYPCPFLLQERFRIGRLANGSVKVYSRVENTGKSCFCKGKL